MLLTYEEKRFLKKGMKLIWRFCILFFALALFIYFADLDFLYKERTLSKNMVDYQIGMVKTPVQESRFVYKNEMNLLITEQVRATGFLLDATDTPLKTNCPYQKERAALYNKYFKGVVLIIDEKPVIFGVIVQNRLMKQALSKISKRSFLKDRNKITLFGYALKLRDYPEVPYNHLVVNKMIINDVVYE